MNDINDELEKWAEQNPLDEEDVIDAIKDELLYLAEEIDYATDEEKEKAAKIVSRKAYEEAIKNGITFTYDDYDLLAEELAKRFFEEFERNLKRDVVLHRRVELSKWIEKLKTTLVELEERKEDKDFLVSEEDLEELFYDLVDEAIDESI